jgi:hypothetical protein
MAVARSSAHFWKLDRLIKQLHMWKIVAGAHRFVGLLTGFVLRDVTRVGETVRVSSRAGGAPVVAQSKQSSHLATRV